ncbi:MAG: metallophosphoesterase family protein [Armatimonadota bacterium]|nr:metallophosphoesterase family protein [Armatimonadota bacterium]MDR5703190.1 metallophosphoesterase family protein [Armatimonadota bacterium]
MRYAVISDIHGNLQALQIVLNDIATKGVDAILCLGDVVGYGPDPNECVTTLQTHRILTLAGNHDWAVIGRLDLDYFNPLAREAILWTRRVLSPEGRAFLESLSLEHRFGDLLAVHGSPRNPIEEYVLDGNTALANFLSSDFQICLIGHSHIPGAFVYTEKEKVSFHQLPVGSPFPLSSGARYILNGGSVGQPRDGDPRASYLILDLTLRTATLVRLDYPVQQTQQRMLQAGLPWPLAERLAYGL